MTKLGAMDGKTASDLPATVTVVQQPESGGSKKSRVNRKHVITAVAIVAVVAMVITAVLVGVKFHLDSTTAIVKHTYEFKKDDGKQVEEDVNTDVKENFVRFHLKDEDSEIWIINDYNRDLQSMKVKRPDGSVCYVAVLNRTDNALPEAMLNASAAKDKVETDNMYYEVAKTPIKDKSMLGTAGEELCENLDVHWMTPTCADQAEEASDDGGRQKRAVCRYLRYYCYYRYYYNYWWRYYYWRRYCYYYWYFYTCWGK